MCPMAEEQSTRGTNDVKDDISKLEAYTQEHSLHSLTHSLTSSFLKSFESIPGNASLNSMNRCPGPSG